MGLILLSQWIHVGSANAILTATSNQIITGNAPQVVALSSADKHGFTVNGVFYSEASGTIKSSEVKEFDGNLTLNDFKVAIYTSTNLDKVENYSDIDGDSADPQEPFKVESTNYWWYDNNGVRIIGNDKKKMIGCGSGFSMPLKLILETKVKAYSQYGIPNESKQITLAKTYQIAPKSQLCYAKPNATNVHSTLQWFSFDGKGTGNGVGWNKPHLNIPDPIGGGGRTSDYVLDFGFKANPTVSNRRFPTTGFPGAQFQLVMTGSQSDYDYHVINNPGNGVSVDTMGSIVINSKPAGTVTVRAVLKRKPSIIHDYSFNPTSVWALPQGDMKGGFDTAVKQCGGINNLFTRKELSNSPVKNAPELSPTPPAINLFTRAIGDSLLGEWGPINKAAYPKSHWNSEFLTKPYWTKDIHSSFAQFTVYADSGCIGIANTKDEKWLDNYIICKG